MLDLQKAFATVDHDILCRKLRAMGVESVEWFRSYLTNRTQTLHFGSAAYLTEESGDSRCITIENMAYRSHIQTRTIAEAIGFRT
ncbi:hypothetical protein DPMN_030936 [Dreissena polymorpha]|uniref:Reverse transcriptase domain-containing protein n=1 Tax=Dreissena polymorpha TaxID=45954 RepID=A0A9D4M198_DREPO|nr:hypothetical protein DPMN_030936 [Dreissena polymorpha]